MHGCASACRCSVFNAAERVVGSMLSFELFRVMSVISTLMIGYPSDLYCSLPRC